MWGIGRVGVRARSRHWGRSRVGARAGHMWVYEGKGEAHARCRGKGIYDM